MKKFTQFLLLLACTCSFILLSAQIPLGNEIPSYSVFFTKLNRDGSRIVIGDPGGGSGGDARVFQFNASTNKWDRLGNPITEAPGEIRSWNGWAGDMSPDRNMVALSSPWGGIRYSGSGITRVFKFENRDWVQVGQTIEGDGPGERSGSSISLSSDGKYVAIGTSSYSNNLGKVSVYQLDDNDNWIRKGEQIFPVGVSSNSFGSVLKLFNNGNSIVIGSAIGVPVSGRSITKIFDFKDGFWQERQASSSLFYNGSGTGNSLALNAAGDILAIGTPDADGGKGRVDIFTADGDDWQPLGNTIWGSKEGARMGFKIAISDEGTRLAVDYYAEQEDYKNVSFFELQDNTWELIGETIVSRNFEGGIFGGDIALSGDGKTFATTETRSWNGIYINAYRDLTVPNPPTLGRDFFVVFPVPFQNEVYVVGRNNQVRLEVLDYLGRKIGQWDLGGTRLFDTSNFQSGVYYFKLSDGTEEKTIMVMKQ
jgi:hypothetical protein